jgi:hypothetical protein
MRKVVATLVSSVSVILGAVGPSSLQAAGDPVIAAAGDIACAPTDPSFNSLAGTETRCRMQATATLLAGAQAVLTLGDNQYEKGEYANFLASYDETWGQQKTITFPSVGNHEYATAGAAGYFKYFGPAAGPSDLGYYSFDLGEWHFAAINSSCGQVGGCGKGKPQYRWLARDLHENAKHECVAAFWHHPRFSSGPHGNSANMRAIFGLLDANKADVVLVGHDHLYERFAPQDMDGNASATGVREFVVGTGGKSLYQFSGIRPNSEFRYNAGYGVLRLTLHPASYDWAFVGTDGSVVDAGSATCV